MKLTKSIISKSLLFGSLFFLIQIESHALPRGFVYLSDVAPTIKQSMMYYGHHNFVGRQIEGYYANQCVLTTYAAYQLKKAQKELQRQGKTLVVYDCYRPRKAVLDFIRYAESDDMRTQSTFYPSLQRKKQMFQKGYVSYRSKHSSGSTVDLAVVSQRDGSYYVGCADKGGDYEISYGTGVDCLDKISHTQSSKVSPAQRRSRAKLVALMSRYGFSNYSKEWWHYTLRNEPYKGKQFNFDVR